MIAARLALALHPADWRATHEHEVMSTLLDLADDNGGRIPSSEIVVLAGRGAWLRARTSIGFWGAIAAVALMLWAQTQQHEGFVTEPYWNEVLTSSAGGLLLVLPVAGALAAWSTASANSARARLRRSLPILLGTLLAYLVTVAAVIAASGWPTSTVANLVIPVVVLAFAATAVGAGVIAGSVLARGWATGVTLVLLGTWYLGPWTNYDISLRNLTGTNILLFPLDLDWDVPPQALVSVLLTALGVAAVAVIVAATARRRARMVTVLCAVLAATVVFVATAAGPTLTESLRVPRDPAQLVCAGSQPSICLWPEIDASQRDTVAGVAATADSLGIPVPAVLSSGSTETSLASRSRADSAQVANAAAAAIVLPWRVDAGEPDDALAVTYALAVLSGADSVSVLPGMSVTVAPKPVEHHLTPDEVQDRLGVHDAEEARALVARWLAGELTGLRTPS